MMIEYLRTWKPTGKLLCYYPNQHSTKSWQNSYFTKYITSSSVLVIIYWPLVLRWPYLIKPSSGIKMGWAFCWLRGCFLDLIRTLYGTFSLESTKRHERSKQFFIWFSTWRRYHSATLTENVFPVGSKTHILTLWSHRMSLTKKTITCFQLTKKLLWKTFSNHPGKSHSN